MGQPSPFSEPSPPFGRAATAVTAGAGVVAFIAYAATAQRSLPTGDSGDLISAAYVLGVPHPPGYPLYTILVHLAMLFPFGTPALLANLLSSLCDALAVSLVAIIVYRLVARTDRVDRRGLDRDAAVAAAAGALLLAFSTTFWAYSLVAEVFALDNLFAAILLLFAIEFASRPRPAFLCILGLISGLAMTNQQTIALLAPSLAVFTLAGLRRQWIARGARSRSTARLVAGEIAGASVLFLVGLVPYIYPLLAARGNPVVDWGDPRSLGSLLALITRANYGSFSLSLGVAQGSLGEQFALLGGNLTLGFVGAGIVLACLGIWRLVRRSAVVSVGLVLAVLVPGPIFVAFANPAFTDAVTRGILERFYILPAVGIGVLAGVGAEGVLAWSRTIRVARVQRRIPVALAMVLLLGLPASAAVAHVGAVDQSGNDVALHYGEDLLGELDPNAILLMRGDENYTSVAYVQFVEGYRRDVAAMDVELLKQPSYVALMRRLHPGVVIPWNAYDEGVTASLTDIVKANLGARPVYYVGAMKEPNWTAGYDEVHAGLARELVPKGAGGDGYQQLRDRSTSYATLRYPNREYPETTWEWIICEHYGIAAFDLAYAIQSEGSKANLALAERLYRTSILLAPDTVVPNAYKDLGVLLSDRNGDPKEIVALWTHFLRLSPNDPDAAAIRQQIVALGGTAP